MPVTARVLALVALVLAPACGDEDDDGGTMDGTTSLPEGVTTAAHTSASNPGPEPEYLCEPGADCIDDSSCGDMECVTFLPDSPTERFSACAVRCKPETAEWDCQATGGTTCGELGACVHNDESLAGRCHDGT